MALKKHRPHSLFVLFLKQLTILTVLVLIEVFVFITLFSTGLNNGFILPANYAENYLIQNKNLIAHSAPFDASLIPASCTYGLFDFDGNYVAGTFSQSTLDAAAAFFKDSPKANSLLFVIARSDGYCIVQYDITAHFATPFLHKLFPNLDLALILLFILIFVLIVIKIAFNFERKLKAALTPLLEEISQIEQKELDIDHKASQIKEFQHVLSALYEMKIALAESLKKEWETQQKRKSNISALAHDIKTPLTIIKGNAELISEENQLEEIYQSAAIINMNADKIERYIKLLIDEAQNNNATVSTGLISLSTLVDSILSQSQSLCNVNGIDLMISYNSLTGDVFLNPDLIERAVLNLVQNAIEHTTTEKKIKLSLEVQGNTLSISIEDFGCGFSDQALKHAKDQFYTDKFERSDEHYGLGMYFTHNVAEKYWGQLTYYNKSNQPGAMVTLEISLLQH